MIGTCAIINCTETEKHSRGGGMCGSAGSGGMYLSTGAAPVNGLFLWGEDFSVEYVHLHNHDKYILSIGCSSQVIQVQLSGNSTSQRICFTIFTIINGVHCLSLAFENPVALGLEPFCLCDIRSFCRFRISLYHVF